MIGYGNSYFLTRISDAGVAPPPSLLLDTYPNAAVAYSLRKLRTAYTGSAIRVRRNIDNAEQDIAFVGNDLDTQTMLDFVGYNMWTYSEEWNNAVWVKSGLNTTGIPPYIDVETAPDSTLTADKITENAISQGHSCYRQFALTNGATYNVSVYLKTGGRDARVTSAISNLATYQVDVDLTNGTLSGNTFPTTPILDSVGNGWYRLSYSVTSLNSATRTAITIQLLNGTSTNYLGNGTSGVFIWGAQISESATVKTYQKTVATAGGNGFVTTWYDQSTNANNSTQTSPTAQSQIVSSGNLIIDAITGKITTTWTTDSYNLTNLITTVQLMYHYMVFNRTSSTQSVAGLSRSNNVAPTMLRWLPTSGDITSRISALITHSTNTATGSNLVTTLRDTSDVVKMFRNSVALTTGISSTIGATFNALGNANASLNSCNFTELVHWNNDQEANRTGIETNANTYWNAY